MSYFQDIGNDARRQYIDAMATFNEHETASAEAASVRGGMHWKDVGGVKYLIRTSGSNQKSLGRQSPETVQIFESFMARKQAAEARLASLTEALTRHERMNRALYVGRAPQILVDLLNKLNAVGIDDHFMVVGTHALYAYESAAGVRITDPGAMQTRDVDFLWDTRKRVSFLAQMDILETSMIGVLQSVDKSFRISDSQKYTAVNDAGFEVDIIRREAIEGDPHPLRITAHESDFWVAQARRSGMLLSSPRFNSLVVAPSGKMASMETVHPLVFANFKRWMSSLDERDPLKRPRDLLQAEIVEKMVEEYLPNYATVKNNSNKP